MLRYVASVLFGVLVIVMGYGLYWFPAAPIRYVNGQYVDKRGEIHARLEFGRMRIWERVFVGSWIASAASGAAYQFAKRRGKSK
jgi:hypothetical protein